MDASQLTRAQIEEKNEELLATKTSLEESVELVRGLREVSSDSEAKIDRYKTRLLELQQSVRVTGIARSARRLIVIYLCID